MLFNRKIFLGSFVTVLLALFGCVFSACSSDEPEQSIELSEDDIPGLWYGRHVYDRGNGSYGEQFLSVWFYDDHTGKLEYETPTSIAMGVFSWSVNKNRIECIGAHASSANDTGEIININFRIDGNRLYPEGKYESFVLTTDGSVEIYEGKEVYDQSELLQQEWISSDGLTIIWLKSNNKFDFYELSEPYGSYKNRENGEFVYSFRKSTLELHFIKGRDIYRTVNYNISKIGERELVLSDSKGKLSFQPYDKIPEEDENADGDGDVESSSVLGQLQEIWSHYDTSVKSVVSNLKLDDKGRIIHFDSKDGYTVEYSYGNNEITMTYKSPKYSIWESVIYKISNGRISRATEKSDDGRGVVTNEITYHYEDNKVVSVQSSFNNLTSSEIVNYVYNITWDSNGDISEIISNRINDGYVDKYRYSYLSIDASFPQFSYLGRFTVYGLPGLDPFLWIEGYFGDLPKHVMKSSYTYSSNNGIEFDTMSYDDIKTTFDPKGRIKQQVLYHKTYFANKTETRMIEFFWGVYAETQP